MNMCTKRPLVGKKKMSSVVIATIQQSICSRFTVFDHFVKLNEWNPVCLHPIAMCSMFWKCISCLRIAPIGSNELFSQRAEMAAAGGQTWEIVGKSSKKSKGTGQSLSKKEKKALVDNMPKMAVGRKLLFIAYSIIFCEHVCMKPRWKFFGQQMLH